MPTVEYVTTTISRGVAAVRRPLGMGEDGGDDAVVKAKGRVRDLGKRIRGWALSKTTSIGVTGCPYAPEPPFYSCSGMVCMSGFYYGGRIARRVADGFVNSFVYMRKDEGGRSMRSSGRIKKRKVFELQGLEEREEVAGTDTVGERKEEEVGSGESKAAATASPVVVKDKKEEKQRVVNVKT